VTPDSKVFALSLISHTNVGKTTLARTLLRRDVGEVRDEAHVTLEAQRYLLLETPAGERIELWDTPGFGDSVRLARRLAGRSNPIGWFVAEIWDRFRDRAFWSSQRAIRNVLEDADVVLYLVNAAEAPADVGYLDAELQVLALLGKPVVVLLNQMGPPQAPERETAEVERWQQRMHAAAHVHTVLAFDAFARCWVQEDALLAAVAATLPQARREGFDRLRAAWRERNLATWRAAMEILAERLARAALDREVVRADGWTGRLRSVGAALGLRRDRQLSARESAMQALAERLDTDIRESTDRLIMLHGLEGRATGVVLARLAEHYAVREPLSEGRAALWGGVVSGALAGLKADLATGGLSMGAGLIAGGVLGALGAAGMARGYNLVRGVDAPSVMWSTEVLDDLVRSALLGYLAVAHYGRGRGDWTQAEHPAFWHEHVDAVVARDKDALVALWTQREVRGAAPERDDTTAAARALAGSLRPWFETASAALLARLYPRADLRSAAESGEPSAAD
jgi:50S ribosome-binding GTPase/Domain of unknown function (DUF3482)